MSFFSASCRMRWLKYIQLRSLSTNAPLSLLFSFSIHIHICFRVQIYLIYNTIVLQKNENTINIFTLLITQLYESIPISYMKVSRYPIYIYPATMLVLYPALRNVPSPLLNVRSPLRNVRSPLRNINRLPILNKTDYLFLINMSSRNYPRLYRVFTLCKTGKSKL